MDTYLNFTEAYVKLGTVSKDSVCEMVHREIIERISKESGGVSVCFKPLTDEDFCRLTKCFDCPDKYGNESYIVDIADNVTIYYTAEITKIYALYAIMRHYESEGIRKGVIYNTPKLPFRCFRSYLPGKKTLQSFKRFIDMQLAFGNNALMLEIGGAMEYKRHPEINRGWVEYCKTIGKPNGNGRNVTKIYKFPKNSFHSDNGDGEFLTYEEVTEIVGYCRERHIELIPEVPSLSHADYLLYNHPEFAEVPDEPFPSFACPLNEGYQKLVDDVLDEVIEVFKPKRINICHDEVYVLGQCPKCKGKDASHLLGDDIIRIYNYLKERNVKTMVWSDGIVSTPHGGDAQYHMRTYWDEKTYFCVNEEKYEVRPFQWFSPEGWKNLKEKDPDAEAWFIPEKQCIDLLPKDIEVMNWYWSHDPNLELGLIKRSVYNVYGNFIATGMPDFAERVSKGVSGVSFSNWGGTDFESLQRTNSFLGLAYNGFACWSKDFDGRKREENIFKVADDVHRYINYDVLTKKHLEITHTTDAVIEHTNFLCGYAIEREMFRMGDYEILFVDGTTKNIPIYWGYNIGNSDINWGYDEIDATLSVGEGGYCTEYVFEPIGVSKPIKDGRKTWYKFVVSIEKDVTSVMLKAFDGYCIELKEIVVTEK